MKRTTILLALLALPGCSRRPSGAATANSQATTQQGAAGDSFPSDSGPHPDGSQWAEQSDPFGAGDYTPKDTLEPLRVVKPSPTVASEMMLPAGMTAIALAASVSSAEVAILVKDQDGGTRVLQWGAGSDRLTTLATLPSGFDGRSIARHPASGTLFVAGRLGAKSEILALVGEEGGRRTDIVYQGPAEINRLVVGPRPFTTDSGLRYRIFYAARTSNGVTTTRTITEDGKIEYQVAGPGGTEKSSPGDGVPINIPSSFAAPSSVHPTGEPLLWQDQRGCTHVVEYDYYETWHGDHPLGGVACGSLVRFAPNGRGLIAWTSGTGGVQVFADSTVPPTVQATMDTFLISPAIVPDGRGVIGAVGRGTGRVAVVFAPITMPLADVTNAWQLGGNLCEGTLFASQGGFLQDAVARDQPASGQLYSVYEAEHYGEGQETPNLVTTDLFWENFEVAYNGVFILQEQRQGIPAFKAFVRAADSVLSRSAPQSMWGRAFAAVDAAEHGTTTGEAGLIVNGDEPAHSSVLDSTFDFSELKPRGHYTSSPAMSRYFREVHYLTTLSGVRGRDATPLAGLPRGVRGAASAWIDGYRAFIAPSRAPLVWDGPSTRIPAAYAKHPWDHPALFPLSWGIDNEALESGVFHEDWPADEQIGVGNDRRLHPSGLDVGVVLGSPLARTLLADTIAHYHRLGPVLDGIAGRRPATTGDRGLYQMWLDALSVEWADTAAFPGAPTGAKLWSIKRLQTGLASWATLREATILVNERPSAAEMGEGGFEELVPEIPRGYVEPAPRAFDAIASLYEALAAQLTLADDPALHAGVQERLKTSAAEARSFAAMARKELRGEPLSDEEYNAIRAVGGTAEHEFLLYKALSDRELGISIPEPMAKVADVAGDTKLGVLEVAVGNPMEWHQIVPYFGRREIVLGSVYSFYEFLSHELYDNEQWRREVGQRPHPEWVRDVIAPPSNECRAPASR